MSLLDKLDPTDLIEKLKPDTEGDGEGLFGQVRDLLGQGSGKGTSDGGIGSAGSEESGSLDLGDIAKLFAGKDAGSEAPTDGAQAGAVNPEDVKNAAKDALSTEGDGKSIFTFAKGLVDDVKDIGGGLKDIVTGDVGGGLKRMAAGVIDVTGFDNPMGQGADQLNEAGLTDWTDEAGRALFTMQFGEEAGGLGEVLGGAYGSAAENAPSVTESLGLDKKDA